MKKILLLISLAAGSYYFYKESNETVQSIEGRWTENGAKTVQSMIEGGKLQTGRGSEKIISVLSDQTYTFTKNTLNISFKSDPDFNGAPLPYEVTEKTDNSVTIKYRLNVGKSNKTTYYFSENGQCIFTKHGAYNHYFCK
jgi:hypothetical protein